MIDIENATECTICYEHTMNRTECDHIICETCMTKIDKCAVCRKDFAVIHVSQERINELQTQLQYVNNAILFCIISVSFGFNDCCVAYVVLSNNSFINQLI